MTTDALAVASPPPKGSAPREWGLSLVRIAAFGVIGALSLVVLFVTLPAMRAIVSTGGTLFGTVWDPSRGAFGLVPFMLGSLIASGLALVCSVPLAFACAATLSELAGPTMRRLSRRLLSLYAAIPSVVFGYVGLVLLVPAIAVRSRSPGLGLLAAAAVLVLVALPTITLLMLDTFEALPASLRQESFALGATRLQTLWKLILPAARPGLLTASLLGLARALGEALAIQMVVGNAPVMPRGLVTPAATLGTGLVAELGMLRRGSAHSDALFAMAFALLLASMLLLAIARRAQRSVRL